jgi:hypothetical protein
MGGDGGVSSGLVMAKHRSPRQPRPTNNWYAGDRVKYRCEAAPRWPGKAQLTLVAEAVESSMGWDGWSRR